MKIKSTNKLKTNNKGFGHLETLLIIVAIGAIVGVGLFVLQSNTNKIKNKAHASSPYMPTAYFAGVLFGVCKTLIPTSVYGGGYKLSFAFAKQVRDPAYYYSFSNYSPTNQWHWGQATTSNSYYAGTIATYTDIVSNLNHDQAVIQLFNASTLAQMGGAAYIQIDLGTSSYNPGAYFYPYAHIWNCP